MNSTTDRNGVIARINQAISLLFPEGSCKSEWGSLAWIHEIKAAFRTRILQAHPDRALILGKNEKQLEGEFVAITNAYRFLCSLSKPKMVMGRDSLNSTHRRNASLYTPKDDAISQDSSDFYRGPLPKKKLRFSEYLFYSKRVSRKAWRQSLVWQQLQRPRIGEIAVEFGFLTEEDVYDILLHLCKEKKLNLFFGEYALRRGLITQFQLKAMVGQQRRIQKRIGKFFIERNIISEKEASQVRMNVIRHNLFCST